MAVPRPPVVLVGGAANALSVARSLSALGVEVHGLDVAPAVAASRFVRPLPLPAAGDRENIVAEYLLGPPGEALRGAVVLAGSDVGITVLARHRERLLERFLLDRSDVRAQLGMLDKLRTYEWAREAGVDTPAFWRLDDPADLERHRDGHVYPLLVKPLLSHRYQALFPDKFRVVHDLEQLRAAHAAVTAAGLTVMLVELIPGPDSLLCSYNTYLDDSSSPEFDFTKRIIRRHPPNMGLASSHVTDWNPAVREPALRLFRHVGLRGVANAEFKLDRRDGRLKLIECNARFTDAAPLLRAAGYDLARYVYFRILDEGYAMPARYRTGLGMTYLSNDLRAFRALRRRGEMTVRQWLGSLPHRQVLPYLRWDDPAPAVHLTLSRWAQWLGRAPAHRAPVKGGRRQEPGTARRG